MFSSNGGYFIDYGLFSLTLLIINNLVNHLSCKNNIFDLVIQNDFKSCPSSVVFLHNDLVGLIIREDGFDLERKFTKETLVTIVNEFKNMLND